MKPGRFFYGYFIHVRTETAEPAIADEFIHSILTCCGFNFYRMFIGVLNSSGNSVSFCYLFCEIQKPGFIYLARNDNLYILHLS